MPKYINAGKLCEDLMSRWKIADKEKEKEIQGLMADVVTPIVVGQPAADVVEVKHGEWIENDNGTYSCSLCQSWIPKEQYYYARYCLHCGADMRGETE